MDMVFAATMAHVTAILAFLIVQTALNAHLIIIITQHASVSGPTYGIYRILIDILFNLDCDPASNCSNHGICKNNGACKCDTGYAGAKCARCAEDYYSYPTCTCTYHFMTTRIFSNLLIDCNPNTSCSGHGTCQSDGSCQCNPGFSGSDCSSCATNYYSYPTCNCMFEFVLWVQFLIITVVCVSGTTCSGHGTCNTTDGTCSCASSFSGSNCSECATNYYSYPTCKCMLLYAILNLQVLI